MPSPCPAVPDGLMHGLYYQIGLRVYHSLYLFKIFSCFYNYIKKINKKYRSCPNPEKNNFPLKTCRPRVPLSSTPNSHISSSSHFFSHFISSSQSQRDGPGRFCPRHDKGAGPRPTPHSGASFEAAFFDVINEFETAPQ